MSDRVELDDIHVARKCACRGWIVAEEGNVQSVGDAVVKHQLNEPHKSFDVEAWRESITPNMPVQTIIRLVTTKKDAA